MSNTNENYINQISALYTRQIFSAVRDHEDSAAELLTLAAACMSARRGLENFNGLSEEDRLNAIGCARDAMVDITQRGDSALFDWFVTTYNQPIVSVGW